MSMITKGVKRVIEDIIRAIIEKAKELAVEGVDVEIEESFAIQNLYKNDYSMKAAQKSPVSVQNAFLNLVSIGVSLNPALKHAYLVPRDGGIVLDVSYMGLMWIAQNAGSIVWGQAKTVRENDSYESIAIDKPPQHKYSAFSDRGGLVGVYCVAKLPSGDYLTEEMSKDEVYIIRDTSKSKDSLYSPWKSFETEMWRKCVVKRASKYWPCSTLGRLEKAVNVINDHEGIEFKQENHIDPMIAYNNLVRELMTSITCIKEGIKKDDLVAASEAWFELPTEEQNILWKAPSSGGIFTTKERDVIRSSEFVRTYYPEPKPFSFIENTPDESEGQSKEDLLIKIENSQSQKELMSLAAELSKASDTDKEDLRQAFSIKNQSSQG